MFQAFTHASASRRIFAPWISQLVLLGRVAVSVAARYDPVGLASHCSAPSIATGPFFVWLPLASSYLSPPNFLSFHITLSYLKGRLEVCLWMYML